MMLGLVVGSVGGCGEDIKVWVVKHPNGQVMEAPVFSRLLLS